MRMREGKEGREKNYIAEIKKYLHELAQSPELVVLPGSTHGTLCTEQSCPRHPLIQSMDSQDNRQILFLFLFLFLFFFFSSQDPLLLFRSCDIDHTLSFSHRRLTVQLLQYILAKKNMGNQDSLLVSLTMWRDARHCWYHI